MPQSWTHYLPILTTVISAFFCLVLIRASMVRRTGPHLNWWAIGAFTYGLGTAIESRITLGGNTVELTKAWYIAGALLGGYPLAQGVVFLHLRRRTASTLAYLMSAIVIIASVAVVFSPVNLAKFEPTRPTGAILLWTWVRLLTPVINLYSFVFLVGGAVMSARRYRKSPHGEARVSGNVLIAIGGLLPGIGGSLAKAGYVEALYILELVGLLFMWAGYEVITRDSRQVIPASAAQLNSSASDVQM